MKFTLLTPFIFSTVVSVSVAGQSHPRANQATLYFQQRGADPKMSSINFYTENGTQNASGGAESFDLTYGGWATREHGSRRWKFEDWLIVRDSRSMIVDLGKKDWSDFKDTPSFPKRIKSLPPQSLGKPTTVIDLSAESRDVSPYRQLVTAKANHLYLMRVFHVGKVTYVMFRIKALVSGDNCVLAWKKVTPPVVDKEK